MSRNRIVLTLFGAHAIAGLAGAQTPSGDGGWKVSLTPYVWAPSVEGTLKIQGIGGDSESEGGSALDYLTGAAMVSFEATRGDWSLLGDVLWAQFTQEGTLDGPLETPFEAQNDELLIGLGAARNLARGESSQVDGVFGLRYLHVDLSLDPEGGSVLDLSARADLLDPFVGLRGRVGGTTGAFGLAYGDIGGFGISSDLTWQVLAGGGWAWSWGDVRLGWREIAYDFDSGGILYDLSAGGPFVGVTFAF
ncbi:MAG: hypothetical protein NTY35_04825 [Planctomycetota bacterium]|nr:hypothetical protein [Planctomycetota bacterium]